MSDADRRERIQSLWDFRRWKREVRDPANAASEGTRTIAVRNAEFYYSIAHVERGWTVRYGARCLVGSMASFGTPWCDPLPAREDALLLAVEAARSHFERTHPTSDSQDEACIAMLEALRGMRGLFGWNEPTPVPDESAEELVDQEAAR